MCSAETPPRLVEVEFDGKTDEIFIDDDVDPVDEKDIEILYEKRSPLKRPRLTRHRCLPSRNEDIFGNGLRLLKPKRDNKRRGQQEQNADEVQLVETEPKFNEFVAFLPNEIISEILNRVSDQNDLLHFRLVSKAWNEFSCIHLKNIHRPIEFDRATQIYSFLTLMRLRIGDKRSTFTRFNLNLVTLPRRSVQLLLTHPQINVTHLIITTDGPFSTRKMPKPKSEADTTDTVLYIIEKLQRLAHITIDFHHYISDEISVVTTYAKAIQHIPSVGLTNISFDPTAESMAAFRLLTQVKPLRLTTLKVEFRKAINTTVDNQKEMLDIFYNWVEDHSGTLLDLGINTCVDAVRIPVLPKLVALSVRVHAMEPHGLETFGTILPSQFPVLKDLELGSFLLRKTNMKYDCGIQAFSADTFPTIETLRLAHIPAESHYEASFPNVKNLHVGPSVTLLNLRNILSYFLDIQHLSVRFSSIARDWWGALTGGVKRPTREQLAYSRIVVDVEKEKIVGGPRRGSCCLAYFTGLKSLKFENSHEDVLDALVYLTLNKYIPPLEKMYVGTMEPLDYPEELLRILRRYHKRLTVEYN